MALTYEWKLTGLRKQDTADITNLVIGTRWTCTGTDEDGTTGKFDGATPFDAPDEGQEGFVPYEELTEELVLSWIKSYVDSQPSYWEHINERIQKQIDETKWSKEDVTTENLPWAPVVEEEEVETPSEEVSGSVE